MILLSLLGCAPSVATVTAHEELPSVARVSWETRASGRGWVRLERDGEQLLTTPLEDSEGTVHEVLVAGLRHGVEHRLVPGLTQDDGSEEEGEAVVWRAPSAPADLPLFEPVQSSEDLVAGYVLLHTLSLDGRDAVVVVDREGEVVWYLFVEAGLSVLSVSLSRDLRSVLFTVHATDYVTTGAEIHQVALDGSFHEIVPVERAHSGVEELPEGGFGYLVKNSEEVDGGVLLWDEVWEQDADGNRRRLFSFTDAFEPERFCEHYDVVIPQDDGTEAVYYDWTHANSLVLSEDGLSWYVMARHFDGVLKIPRSSGELEWVLGGPYSDFQIDPEVPPLDHGHFSWLKDGRLLAFDNGNHRMPPFSKLLGYELDEDARLATVFLDLPDADGSFVEWLGDVRETSWGSLLSSWTTRGRVVESTFTGDVLWQLNSEAYVATGRLRWLSGFYGEGGDLAN